MWNSRDSHSLLGRMQNSTTTLEDNVAVSYKAKPSLPDDPAIVLPDIYPKELKTHVHREMFTEMLIQTCPKSPSIGKWTNYSTSK